MARNSRNGETWSLGQGFGQTTAQDEEETSTDGSQAGEVPFKGESLTAGGKGPGSWAQSATPGSGPGRSGRKVGVKVDVNGFGGGVKDKRYRDGQAQSGNINRDTGHGIPVVDGEENTLDNVAPPTGHDDY